MILIGISLISHLKSYNLPAVVQCKGTVRRWDSFSRVFLNEAERQEGGHRLLNTNTLTLCDYVLRPLSKGSSGWERPKLKAENHPSLTLSFFRCFLKIEYVCDDWCILWVLKAGDPGNVLMERNPGGTRQKLAFGIETRVAERKQMNLLGAVRSRGRLLSFLSSASIHHARRRNGCESHPAEDFKSSKT